MTATTAEPKMITDKQIELIKKLIEQKPYWPAVLSDAHRTGIKNVQAGNEITRLHASQTIDALIKMVAPASHPDAFKPSEKSADAYAAVTEVIKDLPISYYALPRKDGSGWDFFAVVETKISKRRFIRQLLGSPAGWNHKTLSPTMALYAAKHIAEDPKAAAVEYAKQHGRCAVCNAHLSDPESIALGLGPICAKRFV